MKRTEILDATKSILKKAGFRISQRCSSRPSCFDFAVQKEERPTLIKIYANIGNIFANEAKELKIISNFVSATALIIGEKTRQKNLEDDTVYSRYNISAITFKTLENVIFHRMHPMVEAGPGGYYIKLDGSLIREKRQQLGLSVGKMAEMIGISRRTLYGYEKGMAKASVSTAYKLEWVLGVRVIQLVNVFQSPPQDTELSTTVNQSSIAQNFLQRVSRKLAQLNLKVVGMGKAPFDFIANHPEKGIKVVGGVTNKLENNIDQRTQEILSFSKIVDAYPVFITDGKEIPNNNIPLIHHKDLEKMCCLEDFIVQL